MGLILLLWLVLAPATAQAAEGDPSMAPIWTAAVIQFVFTIAAGVALFIWQRSATGMDRMLQDLTRQVEQLRTTLAATREEFARRSEMNEALGRFAEDARQRDGKFERLVEELRKEVHAVHRLLRGDRNV